MRSSEAPTADVGTRPAILEMRGVTKEFPSAKALDNVNLAVRTGEIHSICGENGAAKSTLMKVLFGARLCRACDGEIVHHGELVELGGYSMTAMTGIRQSTSRRSRRPRVLRCAVRLSPRGQCTSAPSRSGRGSWFPQVLRNRLCIDSVVTLQFKEEVE